MTRLGRATVLRLVEDLGVAGAARVLCVSKSTVERRLRGWKSRHSERAAARRLRTREPRQQVDVDRALHLVKKLGTCRRAAEEMGLCHRLLSRRFRAAGICLGQSAGRGIPDGASVGETLQRRFADIYKVDHCPTGACRGEEIPIAI